MLLNGRRIPMHLWPQALEVLVQQSVRDRRAGTPPLSRTRVKYVREPRGRERWQSAGYTALAGEGDCEDLAVYLAADLRLRGIPARAVIKRVNPRTRHALVHVRWKGRDYWFDPSRVRGMGGEEE